MAENGKDPKKKLNNKDPKDPKKNRKKIIINLAVVFGLFLIFLISTGLATDFGVEEEQKTFSDLVTEVRNGNVSEITVTQSKEELEVELYETAEKNRDDVVTETYPNLSNGTVLENLQNALGEDEQLKIGSGDGEIVYKEVPQSFFSKLVSSAFFGITLQILIIALIAIYLLRKLSNINSKSMAFGNSRAKLFEELKGKKKVTFKDVAGNEEAKQELNEVVDFLKRPDEFIDMGARIPRGVLVVGSPGNGKTLMAKAVAGEAGVPFLFVSGSEFVEMFVGVGAGRVRDLFKQAKKKSPCVIFIDEIDAVGRKRGSGLGNSNDEREQTLNQILVEMDGFEENESVIVIGATNRPDVLDPALLRPGRFDRQVTVTAPDREERKKILEVHARGKKIAKEADLGIIAKRTPGFSGADLMNVLNESAILAVREGKKMINNTVMREAVEKVLLGPSLKSKIITEEQKRLTAYHEAGHALVATILPEAEKVQKVTIIPRGKAGGYTFTLDKDSDKTITKKSKFLSEITVLYGGYVAEEIMFGETSTGPSNDLARATEVARNMVTKYGMSDLGPYSFDENGQPAYLGRDIMEKKHFSEHTGKEIDEAIEAILDICYKECKKVLKTYREELGKLAEALIEKESLELEEFNDLIGHLANPPLEEE